MKHRLGVSVGVVLLGIGVAPFWMGKSAETTHSATGKAAASSSGKRDYLVASAADDYIPPLIGFTDDDLIDNPRLNPVLALTGGDAYEEPGRLMFSAEYMPRLPVAPTLLLMGGYDAPRLTPFPNPGVPNLFGANQLDSPPPPALDNSSHASNASGYTPAAPASINPSAPLTFPRPSPNLAQPMPMSQGPGQGGFNQQAQGGYGPPAGQFQGPGYANAPQGGPGAPPMGYAGPGAGPGYGAPPQYPMGQMGQPDMLAYAGPESGPPGGGQTPPPPMAGYQGAPYQGAGYPAAPYQGAGYQGAPYQGAAHHEGGYQQGGYQQPAQGYAGQGYPSANYGAQSGYGYGQNCGCQSGQGFGGHGVASYGSTFGGYVQGAPMMEGGFGNQFGGPVEMGGHFGEHSAFGGQFGGPVEFGGQFGGCSSGGCSSFGGFHGGMSPVSYGMGSFGEEGGFGGFGGASFGGGHSGMVYGGMSMGGCGSEMGSFSMGGGMSYGAPMEGYSGCYSNGCGSQRRGLFGRLKDWFKGGSRCNDNGYDGCNEQKSCGLFSRIKNLFRKKKDCYGPTPIYSGGDCGGYGGGFEGSFGGGYGGGFGGGYSGGCQGGYGY